MVTSNFGHEVEMRQFRTRALKNDNVGHNRLNYVIECHATKTIGKHGEKLSKKHFKLIHLCTAKCKKHHRNHRVSIYVTYNSCRP